MQPKIVKISQTTIMDGNNRTVPAIQVEFMVGTHGPFFATFPKQGFNIATVQQEMQQMAQHVATLTQ